MKRIITGCLTVLGFLTLSACGGGGSGSSTSSQSASTAAPSGITSTTSSTGSTSSTSSTITPTSAVGSNLTAISGSIVATFQTTTRTSVFAYMDKPSWDLIANVQVKNTSGSDMYLVGLDNKFQIGACSSQNAEGIDKSLVGIGQIDSFYLQPGVPYKLPVSQFTYLSNGSTVTLTISLQGCSSAFFTRGTQVSTLSIAAAAQFPDGSLQRTDLSVSQVPVKFSN